MAYALFKPHNRTHYPDKTQEPVYRNAVFTVHKFNNRPRPVRSKVTIVGCFSEFGCEIVGCLYCVPRIVRRFPGKYIIAMGWYGRAYLYRHLVDEFWEINEEYMGLRDYTYAFHHNSNNLKKIEESAAKYGTVIPSSMLGTFAVSNYCRTCGHSWTEWRKNEDKCPRCNSTYIVASIFGGAKNYKKEAVRLPPPSESQNELAAKLTGNNSVGIFARNRKTYGRNLPSEFYQNLIELIQSMGYSIVWMGERHNTLPCPDTRIYDHSRSESSRDLGLTLAMISRMKFTIQFWTASSRLSGMVGTPYVLFESPEQIYSTGNMPGQEGRRLELTTFGDRKVVISHYLSAFQNQDYCLELAKRAIEELLSGNTEDIIGLVEDEDKVRSLKSEFYREIRG